MLLQINNLHKDFKRGKEMVHVLNDLSIEVEKGDFLALMGPSGSGKSTLLNMIGGIDRPTSGSLVFDEVPIHDLSEKGLSQWRADHVGFVFQMFNLMPVLNAWRNVELPLLLTKLGAKDRKKHAHAALDLVGLSHRATHKPGELSGGEEQRVGIARAIVTDPDLLLCDEPTGDLDRKSGGEILDLLQALNEQQGKTIIMVTHDLRAAEHAKRILYMEDGKISRTRNI